MTISKSKSPNPTSQRKRRLKCRSFSKRAKSWKKSQKEGFDHFWDSMLYRVSDYQTWNLDFPTEIRIFLTNYLLWKWRWEFQLLFMTVCSFRILNQKSRKISKPKKPCRQKYPHPNHRRKYASQSRLRLAPIKASERRKLRVRFLVLFGFSSVAI